MDCFPPRPSASRSQRRRARPRKDGGLLRPTASQRRDEAVRGRRGRARARAGRPAAGTPGRRRTAPTGWRPPRGGGLAAGQARPARGGVRPLRHEGGAGLDFDSLQPAGLVLAHDVYLASGVVAPEMDVGRAPGVETCLDQFRHHERLEQRPALGVHRHARGVSQAEKVRGEPGVEEVELRRLDEALAEVAVIRPEQRDQVARFEDGQPLARRHVRDAAVGAEGRQVQDLPGARRAEFHEALEQAEVLDREHLPDVALEIGRDVAREPVRRRQVPVVQGRVAASPEQIVEGPGQQTGITQLTHRERQPDRPDRRATG